MNETDYWIDFKSILREHYPDHGYNAPLIFAFGLSSKVSEVFEITQKELKTGETFNKGRISALKKVFSYIAYLEIFYDLPDSPYTKFLGTEFVGLNYDLNLLDVQGEALAHISMLSTSIVDMDDTTIQICLNKLIMCMFDVCCIYGIDTKDIVTFSAAPAVKDEKAPKHDFNKDTIADRKAIKKSKSIEALVEIKHDMRSKNTKYRGVTVKIEGRPKVFHKGDVITDFFSASNYIAEVLKDRKYKLNFGPKFRRLLTADPNVIFMGYIMANGIDPFIKTAAEVRSESDTEGATQGVAKDEGRPVLLAPHICTFGSLLDHVQKTKNKHKAEAIK